jgi:DHA2 family multidrug resistance protein-like MFS transporter
MGSLGIAIYRSQITAALPTNIAPEIAEAIKETLGGAVAVAGQLPSQTGAALLSDASRAFVLGIHLTSLIGTVILVGLAVLTAVMLRNIAIHGEEAEQPHSAPDALIEVPAAIQIETVPEPANC